MGQQRILTSTYIYALSQIRGIGRRAIIDITKTFPTVQDFTAASQKSFGHLFSQRLTNILAESREQWPSIWKSAEDMISSHLSQGIIPIPFGDNCYPVLLGKISDPPSLLYVRGNIDALSSPNSVAVIGTRNPTKNGLEVAREIAKQLACRGYVIISGLAKGIDTAAHQGAIDGRGVTVAVLGTPIDKVYPAENKKLADAIITDGGALVSEYGISQKTFKNAFVERDRIQSGLSLAVIPVQTDVVGGTMHTVCFAQQQGRLVLCPRPVSHESAIKQYKGIWHLIKTGNGKAFETSDEGFSSIGKELNTHKYCLLGVKDLSASDMLTTPHKGNQGHESYYQLSIDQLKD